MLGSVAAHRIDAAIEIAEDAPVCGATGTSNALASAAIYLPSEKPPILPTSGWTVSIASRAINSLNAQRLNSDSPPATAMSSECASLMPSPSARPLAHVQLDRAEALAGKFFGLVHQHLCGLEQQ